jgi:hypothetical protein
LPKEAAARKFLRWLAIVPGALIAFIWLIAFGLSTKTRRDFEKECTVQVESVMVPTDAAPIPHGQQMATILCTECHVEYWGGTPGDSASPEFKHAQAPILRMLVVPARGHTAAWCADYPPWNWAVAKMSQPSTL